MRIRFRFGVGECVEGVAAGCRILVYLCASDDQRVVMVVFDGAASAFAIAGWVLIGAAFYSLRRQPPPEPEWSMPVDRG